MEKIKLKLGYPISQRIVTDDVEKRIINAMLISTMGMLTPEGRRGVIKLIKDEEKQKEST